MRGELSDALIELPWPAPCLSANARVHWRRKSAATKIHREWAYFAALEARPKHPNGDIPVSVTFYPPNNRLDRANMPHLVKAYFDGIADAMKINDRRFLPSFHFAEPVKGGRVIVRIG
jgi:crossover junction endodeoxyribonuclease RusA